jgi:hypothetical protein
MNFSSVQWLLFLTSLYDIFRGLMHTVFADYAITNIAKVPDSIGKSNEYLILMNGFGFANFSNAAIKMYSVINNDKNMMLYLLFIYGVMIIINFIQSEIKYKFKQDQYPGRYFMLTIGVVYIIAFFLFKNGVIT